MLTRKQRIRAANWMRKHPTKAEKQMYAYLMFLGERVRRQYKISPYIADFCLPRRKLIIEVDGSSHKNRKAYDGRRDAWIRSKGFHILRYTNEQVFETGAAGLILRAVRQFERLDAEAISLLPQSVKDRLGIDQPLQS